MSIYKKTTELSFIITIASLFLSFINISKLGNYAAWVNNVCIGLFSSGFLTLFSSLTGYLIEEKKTSMEFCWKIKELKDKVLNFQTLYNSNMDTYICALMDVNTLLREYFAIWDNDFFFCRRKKIQKMYEIHTLLQLANEKTSDMVLCATKYRAKCVDEEGKLRYTMKQFKDDIKEDEEILFDYHGTGMPLTIWLQEKENEYSKILFRKNF